jgi:hypothetical protein
MPEYYLPQNVAAMGMQMNLENIPELAELVRKYMAAIEQGRGGQLNEPGAWVDPMLQQAIRGQQQGVSPEEMEAARGDVTGTYQQALGGLSGRGASGGYFSRIARGAQGAQLARRQLAPALGQMRARFAETRRKGGGQALQALTGVYGQAQAAGQGKRSAYEALMGRLLRSGGGLHPSKQPLMRGGRW